MTILPTDRCAIHSILLLGIGFRLAKQLFKWTEDILCDGEVASKNITPFEGSASTMIDANCHASAIDVSVVPSVKVSGHLSR